MDEPLHEPGGTSIDDLREATAAAAQLFASGPRRHAAIVYLRQRGIDASQLDSAWFLGYAPPGWTRLVSALRDRFDDQVLLDAGLARRSTRGTLYDAFRDRVIFGIRDADGRIAGFVGRNLADDPIAPKYLNSCRSQVFDKSTLLHGLSEGSDRRQPVIVEGPLDVLAIACRSDAADLVPVAPCGTAFTRTHARLIAEVAFVHEAPVVVAMDGDGAGRRAALDVGECLRRAGLDVRLATLPNGSDPAGYLARPGVGIETFRAESGVPLVAGHLQHEIAKQGDGMQWIEGRLGAMRGMARYLATYPHQYIARQVGWLSDVLQLAPTTVTRELANALTAKEREEAPAPTRSIVV